MNSFERSYLECALWSSCNDNGNPLDDRFDILDLTDDAKRKMLKDCENFQEANVLLLAKAGSDEQNGHDFWLTRNGHGAGFWDRGYGQVGDELTKACKAYGPVDLIVGDDLRIHC